MIANQLGVNRYSIAEVNSKYVATPPTFDINMSGVANSFKACNPEDETENFNVPKIE